MTVSYSPAWRSPAADLGWRSEDDAAIKTPPAADYGRRSGAERLCATAPGEPATPAPPRGRGGQAPESSPQAHGSGATQAFLAGVGGKGAAVARDPAAAPTTDRQVRTGEVPTPGLTAPAGTGVSEAPAGGGTPTGAGDKP